MYLALIVLSCIVLAANASDVIELSDSNFEDKVKEYDVILIEFYAPWCGHCKKLAPEYEVAATKLKNNDPPVPLAKVDCTAETATCGKFGVSGYPTLKIFKGGEFSKEYNGPRESAGIIKTMQREAGPTSKEITQSSELEEFLSRPGASVVAFCQEAGCPLIKTLQKVSDSYEDLRFAYTTSKEVREKYKRDEDKIVLFRSKVLDNKFEDSAVELTGDASSSSLKTFLDNESFGLCGVRTNSNADKFKKPLFVAFYDVDYVKNPKGSNYWRNRILKTAKNLLEKKVKAYFAVSDKKEFSHELQECGLSDVTGDKPVICGYDAANRKYPLKSFSPEALEELVVNVLDGKVEPYLKSEPIPQSNDDPVKVVVAKNFDDIVNDNDKDVLIEFYAPWCGHCKSLAPKYDELAEKLKDEDEITIAKMDATANDVPSPYDVKGFPTLYFAPKGSKSSPRKYEGGREVDEFIKYLAKESTNELKGWDRKGKKKGKKDKKTEL